MRYVKLPFGDEVHLVFDSACDFTICGLSAKTAAEVKKPHDRLCCHNCDKKWRKLGRQNKPARTSKPGYKPGTYYRPRLTIKDWEAEE
jgi:hypothetical protein